MYVISYDITSNKLRNKIAKTLEGYGRRVQYSVFECKITLKQYEILYKKLLELMKDVTEGNIRIYKICMNCEQNIITIGVVKKEVELNKEDIFIV